MSELRPTPRVSLVAAFGALLAVVAVAPALRSQENWADPALPVRDAMVTWLDATRQEVARSDHGLPARPSGGKVSVVFDASGAGRHFAQSDGGAQPLLLQESVAGEPVAALRFDGEDDHLLGGAAGERTDVYTVVLVARIASNSGGFRALFAAHALGRNDYTSGLNIDLGWTGSTSWSALNVEGPGYVGAVDLLKDIHPFGDEFHIVAVRGRRDRIDLRFDGDAQDSRPRDVLPASLERLTLGARSFCNSGDPPFTVGFLDGEVAELIVYERDLTDDELARVTEYLGRKHRPLLEGLAFSREGGAAVAEESGLRLVTETPGEPDGPPVAVLVPGFEVDELPVELRNINNLRYRRGGPDGSESPRLVAMAYDGRILLLEDTDGDGLEDEVTVFWDRPSLRSPIGIALTPPGDARGFGVFVASKGKVSLILDEDGDDRADREVVVADGWQELPHGVDALGVAVDRDGSVYFGLGCTNFTNAYLVDPATREAGYRLDSERGTILRVAPDFSRREIVSTGIRFPVALGFNRHGDLFATDQEGETWLPGGNPRDELLHVLPSRHYGFPPRHDDYLPDVVDEPSTFDYGPQHQSTCGFVFNESSDELERFGPAHFEGDAFVTGYSRGIIYRTKLHRRGGDPASYTARTSVFARFGLLSVDACVSPRGDLVVATHSGGPDWGSGPQGSGRLFRIRYVDRSVPQPILAWAESPIETRITFDRELSEAQLEATDFAITYGDAVRAADRYEVHRPGYEVVREQLEEPRYRLAVDGARLSEDGRTIVLRTRPHPYRTHFALRATSSDADRTFDLDYDLCGVEARWHPDASEGDGADDLAWSGWLPHIEPAASVAFLAGTARGDALRRLLERPGHLELVTALAPFDEPRRLVIRSSHALYAGIDGDVVEAGRRAGGGFEVRFDLDAHRPATSLSVRLETGPDTDLTVTVEHPRDSIERPLSAQAHYAPWSAAPAVPVAGAATVVREARSARSLDGIDGHWLRGRGVFFGEGRCAACHRIRGRGREIGPDLSNLVHRDLRSVREDIALPSARIHPDYVSYTVVTRRGDVHSGLLRTRSDGSLGVFDSDGEETVIAAGDVVSFEPQSASLMPDGLGETVGEEKVEDLLTFLLVPPPSMPGADTVAGPHEAPPPRTEAEVLAALAGGEPPREEAAPLDVVLVAGPKDHGPGEHDYPAWQETWARLLGMADGVRVSSAWEWPEPEAFESADVLVFFQKGSWDDTRAAAIDAYLARGGGLVYLHYAVDGGADPAGFAERIGLAWQGGRSRFRHGDLELVFAETSADGGRGRHPIARNFERLQLHDESYWQLVGDPDDVHVLASAEEDGAPQPLIWTREAGRGRVFVSIIGHYSFTFDDPLFRLLVLRGIAWSAGRSVDRLNELVWPGAAVVWDPSAAAGDLPRP